MNRFVFAWIGLATVALAIAACNGADDAPAATPTSPADATPTATTAPPEESPTAEPAVADCLPNLASQGGGEITWQQIVPDSIPAPEGWEVRDDSGGGPFLAVFSGAERLGTLELLSFPLEPDFNPQLGFAELEEWLDAFYSDIEADRAAGYGEGYSFEAHTPQPVSFGSFCGIRYGFTGILNGETFERFIGHASFDATNLYIVTAFFDSATAAEGIGFRDEASLQAYEESLTELIESLTFP